MVTILTHIKVQDFDTFNLTFAAARLLAKAAGELEVRVFRGVDDDAEVLLWGVWPDANTARRFLNSEPLQAGKKEKGWWVRQATVIAGPEVYLLSELGFSGDPALFRDVPEKPSPA